MTKSFNKISDENIVKIIRTKNKELFREIIKRYERKLLRYAIRLVGDFEKAQDIVQETFIKSFINLNSFNTKQKFSSWIYRITHNLSINVLKKEKRIIRAPLFLLLQKSNDNIENEIAKEELEKNIKICLKRIPTIYSEVLTLYFLEEKSYVEISYILKISAGTVAIRLNRAKNLMKEICKKN